jgi:hypothetical protein
MNRNPKTMRARNLPMRRAVRVDLTEVEDTLREVQAYLAIDVLALQNADEAMHGDIEDIQGD